MKFKKSAVDLTDLALGIVVLGIVVSVGATILTSARDARLTDLNQVTTSLEKITPSGNSGTALAKTWVANIINVSNATGGNLVSSENYTVTISSTNGQARISNSSSTFPGDWNVTYKWYNTSRPDWALPNNASNGLGEYGNWFKIIVIVGVAAVVLSLIFMAFGRGNSASGGEIGGSY